MTLVRIQSPVSEYPPQGHVQPQTLTIGDSMRQYRYVPGGEVHVTPEDAAWVVAQMQGWMMVGPVEELSPEERS